MTVEAQQPQLYRLAARWWAMPLLVLAYFFGFALVAVQLTDVAAASRLGSNPGHAVALSGERPCGKCHPVVSYLVADSLYRESVDGSSDSDHWPGTALVYERGNPSRVMTLQTWRSGSSNYWIEGLAWALGVCGALTAFVVLTGRRRAWLFGDLRPDVAITDATYRRRYRGGSYWRVAFADGKIAAYRDSRSVRSALKSRQGSENWVSK